MKKYTQDELNIINSMITEFTGYPVTLYKEDDFTYIDLCGEKNYASFDCELVIINNTPYEVKDLLFHKEWNWLMPVAKQCQDICSQQGKITNEIYWLNVFEKKIRVAVGSYNLEETFEKVIDFIGYYNDNFKNIKV